jgi:hypothetical protein
MGLSYCGRGRQARALFSSSGQVILKRHEQADQLRRRALRFKLNRG